MVGWVPVEVTPPYVEKMPAINTDNYPLFNADDALGSNENSAENAGQTEKKEVQEEQEEQEEQDVPEEDKHVASVTSVCQCVHRHCAGCIHCIFGE